MQPDADSFAAARLVSPSTGREMAAALRDAAATQATTVIRGSGTKIGWGRVAPNVDVVVETSRLNRVLAHRHGDLTATIEAGTTLAAANEELARHGQWLPLDSSFAAATIGGIVATNDSGPLRHRYGTPRDLLIGVTLALTDGRIVKSGGTVVKNVAGYDLGRLVSGSFGTLAAIETATFKLAPLPTTSGTVSLSYGDPETLTRDARAIVTSQFELTAVDLHVNLGQQQQYRLLARVASSPPATDAQLFGLKSMLQGAAAVIHGEEETNLWGAQRHEPWTGDGPTLRFSWRPADLRKVLTLLGQIHESVNVPLTLTGRVGIGAGLLRVDGTAPAQVNVVTALRATALVGNVVVLRAPVTVKEAINVWGAIGNSASVMRALKKALDPAGILNANRGPI